MSDSREYSSAEYEVLKRIVDTLCVLFKVAPLKLNRLFYSKGLLSNEVYDLINDCTVDIITSVETMVTALTLQVKINPAAYYAIVGVLKQVDRTEFFGNFMEEEVRVEKEEMRKMAKEKNQELMGAEFNPHYQDPGDVGRQYLTPKMTDHMTYTTKAQNSPRSITTTSDPGMPFGGHFSTLTGSPPKRRYTELSCDDRLKNCPDVRAGRNAHIYGCFDNVSIVLDYRCIT